MSPGRVMMRVYIALKTRIMAGEFAPGERLDPARLAPGLGTSRSPVRDALHRLSGERLVDTWEDEGFRQPFVSELAMRDLYEWANEICHAALRAAARRPAHASLSIGAVPSDYVGAITWCFLHIAARSANDEHRLALSALNDRLWLMRLGEIDALDGAMEDAHLLVAAITGGDLADIARAVEAHHRRRIRGIPGIAAALRRRAPVQS